MSEGGALIVGFNLRPFISQEVICTGRRRGDGGEGLEMDQKQKSPRTEIRGLP